MDPASQMVPTPCLGMERQANTQMSLVGTGAVVNQKTLSIPLRMEVHLMDQALLAPRVLSPGNHLIKRVVVQIGTGQGISLAMVLRFLHLQDLLMVLEFQVHPTLSLVMGLGMNPMAPM